MNRQPIDFSLKSLTKKSKEFIKTNKDSFLLSRMTMLCILMNVLGRVISDTYSLPLWMDAFGTVLIAYMYGPICGAIVGGAGNIIWGLFHPMSYIYSLTSIAIGVIAGIATKRKSFDTLFGTLSISVLITLSSVVISTPLNLILYGGSTGNMWGDGVIGFLKERKINGFFSAVAGEFYIDFLDKFLTMFALYLLIRCIRFLRERKTSKEKLSVKYILKRVFRVFIIIASTFALLGVSTISTDSVLAITNETKSRNISKYDSYVQTRYSSNNGLPCGTANDIAQTNNGILWIGTYAGLYRYNGTSFRWMNEFESVRNVNCLFNDEEGRLWIGTNDNGLSIMINDKIANVVDEQGGLPSNSVRCIEESSDGDYYIGTTDSMQIISLSGGLKTLNTFPEIVYANSISTDDDGNVAVVTSTGELFILNHRKIVYQKSLEDSDDIYTTCTFRQDGSLYVGTSSQKIDIYHLLEEGLKLDGQLDCGQLTQLNKLYFDDNNQLFICGDNGIGVFDENNVYTDINTNTFNNSIDDMTIDYQGDLWFTSSRMGLLRLCKSSFVDLYSQIGIEKDVVNSVTKWNNHLYIGSDTGLTIVDENSNSVLNDNLTKTLQGIRIRCIRTDSKNHLWICTYGKGLVEVDDQQKITFYSSDNGSFGQRARVVMELSDGTIAAAGDTGISLIRDGHVEKTFRYGDKLSNTLILTLLELPNHSLLAGTDGDGMVVIKDGEIVRKITRSEGLSSGVILRIVADSKGEGVFIVTSNGLCYMDSKWKIHTLDHFPYFNNYDICVGPDHNLFVLGSCGIYVVNESDLINDKENLDYELLNDKSGLTSALTANSWNYCDDEHNLYISSDSGVFKLNLDRYSNTSRSYRMMVSEIKLDNESLIPDRNQNTVIDRDVSRIEIFLEVINYTIDDPYVRYYLEGFDESPKTVLQSELTNIVYTNLPKGEYTFHMAVLDNKKTAVLEETSYVLIKEKAIYDNQWFQIYMLVIIMLAVSWLTWFIVRTQIQRTINFQRKELSFVREQVKMGNETILAIAKTVDAKDVLTSEHSVRVSRYSVLIAQKLGFSEDECENLRKAALLHDIGKIGIADRVLNKSGRLTEEEYTIMKSHVSKGAEILKDFTLVDHVIDGALYHHERYDGKGYAHGLKGEEIPLYGRIIGVADAFDAMTSNRVYRHQLDFDYVIDELKRCKGTQFDPSMVDIMLELIEEGKIDISELYKNVDIKEGFNQDEK